MSAPLRISVDDLRKRMESGEDLPIVDVRKPEAWAESDTMIPECIHFPRDQTSHSSEDSQGQTGRRILHLTQ
jgi:rhodanese-related sulfurtransferase